MEEYDSTISSYGSSTDSIAGITLTDEEIQELIEKFKKDINRNCGIFLTLKHRSKKSRETQSVVNKKCVITEQHNNKINVIVQKNLEVPFDIPRFYNQFFGRQTQLKNLHKILEQHKLAIITGKEGIGKTEFTKLYIEKYLKKYDNIEWINGSTKDKFDQSINYLSNKYNIDNNPKYIAEYFQKKNTLFVIDNAYERIQYRQYFPRSSQISILITTQFPDLNNKKSLLNLSTLTPEETTDIFQAKFLDEFSRSEEYDWIKLGTYFGNIPIAIQLISGSLYEEMNHDQTLKVEKYCQILETKKKLIVRNYLFDEYNMTYLSLIRSLENINTFEKESILVLEILNICVYLDDDYITKQTLITHLKKSKDKLDEILNILTKYKLVTMIIKQNNNEIHIHSLIRKLLVGQQKQQHTASNYFRLVLDMMITLNNIYHIKYILQFAGEFIQELMEYIQDKDVTFLLDPIISNGHDQILSLILDFVPYGHPELLIKAIDAEQPKIVAVLTKHKVDVNVLSRKLRSPLHRASRKCSLAIILLLLSAGGNPNACDYKNNTPLHTIVKIGYNGTKDEDKAIHCAKALIKYGADPNVQDVKGDTPLHIAIENKAFKLALYLLEHVDINVHIINLNDETVLIKILYWELSTLKEEMFAYNIIRSLLLKGANKDIYDIEGRNLLLWAIDNKSKRIIDLLLEECSMNVDYQDTKGHTALHKILNQPIPTRKQTQITISIVRTLIQHKARTDIEDHDGYTAYELSQRHGNVKLCLFVQFLRKELPKNKKVYYLPEKKHGRLKQQSTRPPFWNNETYSYSTVNSNAGLIQYASSALLTQSTSLWNPASLPGQSYCNNLLN